MGEAGDAVAVAEAEDNAVLFTLECLQNTSKCCQNVTFDIVSRAAIFH